MPKHPMSASWKEHRLDVCVLQMPFVSEGLDSGRGELADLLPHRRSRFVDIVEPHDCFELKLFDEIGEQTSRRRAVRLCNEGLRFSRQELPGRVRRQPEIVRSYVLPLAHRYAAETLRGVLRNGEERDALFQCSKTSRRLRALRISDELAHALIVGREPGEPVGRALMHLAQFGSKRPLRMTNARTASVAAASKSELAACAARSPASLPMLRNSAFMPPFSRAYQRA